MKTAPAPLFQLNMVQPKEMKLATEKKPAFEWDFDSNFKSKAMKEIRSALQDLQKLQTIEF